MSVTPMVSVGIPTYNRPDLLEKALQSLAQQDYSNIEVVVGDNSDPDISTHVRQICLEYVKKISTLRYFGHPKNMGATYNFNFVLHQSSGKFFMWMPDDYRLLDANYLSVLVDAIGESTLVFPLFVLSHMGESASRKFFDVYEGLASPTQYLDAWCQNGSGHPIYGLYNRQLLLNGSYLDLLARCSSWTYFNEGLFLHKLFIDDAVRYCSKVRSLVDSSSSVLRATQEDLVRSFCRYSFETAMLFAEANLEKSRKDRVVELLIEKHSDFYASYLREPVEAQDSTSKLSAYKRLRTAARILVKGR